MSASSRAFSSSAAAVPWPCMGGGGGSPNKKKKKKNNKDNTKKVVAHKKRRRTDIEIDSRKKYTYAAYEEDNNKYTNNDALDNHSDAYQVVDRSRSKSRPNGRRDEQPRRQQHAPEDEDIFSRKKKSSKTNRRLRDPFLQGSSSEDDENEEEDNQVGYNDGNSHNSQSHAESDQERNRQRQRQRRRRSPSNDGSEDEDDADEYSDRGRGRHGNSQDPDSVPRRNKKDNPHAPQEFSSKVQVSRFRQVIPSLKAKSRDPRFDGPAQAGAFNEAHFRNVYSFIDDYRREELEVLKKKMKKTKSETRKAELQAEVTRLTQELRDGELKDQKRAVQQQLNTERREAAKQGQKPFFLKKRAAKSLGLGQRFMDLKKQGRLSRVIEKRRRKKAAKDHKWMPSER